MDNTVKQQIKDAIALRLANSGVSQNVLSRQMGIHASTLSFMLNDKWGSVGNDKWVRAKCFLGIGEWQTIATYKSKKVTTVCDTARDTKRMVAIVGKTGYGKTTALESYAGKHASNTAYVFCHNMMTKKRFVESIAKAFGISHLGSAPMVLNRIEERMKRDDTPLLILDDFRKVAGPIRGVVQLLFDLTVNKGFAAIVLAGTEELKEYIQSCAGYGYAGFPEFERRITNWVVLKMPTIKDVTNICKLNGINDRLCINAISRNIQNFGHLESLISNAKRAAKGSPITLDHIEMAIAS